MREAVGAVCYRAGQFFRALTARVSEEEIVRAMGILTPEAQVLFRRQSAQDQHHALRVYRVLNAGGHTNRHLLAAALLHDVGKAAARLAVWHRVVIVLLGCLAPRMLERLGQGEEDGWRQPFVVHARHAETGARWAEEAGCTLLTVALIRRHHERLLACSSEEDRLLLALQAADNQN